MSVEGSLKEHRVHCKGFLVLSFKHTDERPEEHCRTSCKTGHGSIPHGSTGSPCADLLRAGKTHIRASSTKQTHVGILPGVSLLAHSRRLSYYIVFFTTEVLFHVKRSANEIADAMRTLGIPFQQDQAKQSARYLDLVLDQNKKTNLVSPQDEERLFERHFLDSLMPIPLLVFMQGSSVLDIGSGGGFPSIPLAIARPDLHITAAESKTKKCSFLETVNQELHLTSMHVINISVDARTKMGPFDYCISRAVCELRDFIKACGPHLKPDGKMYTFKAPPALPEEIRHLKSSSLDQRYKIEKVVDYKLPGVAQSFCLVAVCAKV